ncbi:MAG: deoxyguanosinetriphosphate triphosphohydrolase [Desulfurivibrionaceae bacterium]|nr:deoxyguanosinetriphosphate triphosphohydrolase [Desulfurivibrionaceae bacterium]
MTPTLRHEMLEREARSLSPHACLNKESKGRFHPEKECPIRLPFQRDRDRIIHSKTFRRLTHKTQVFLAPTGDHYRTRLTHALEVSQIARTIGVALRLNEHLIEAIALGHDLGHTPFGHAGESVLNELHPGGFRHYEQSLRVVDHLENKGRGLNLTHEVRNGIVHHSKGLNDILPTDFTALPDSLEGQVVRIADILAYVNHDLDDAIRAGILEIKGELKEILQILGQKNSQRISTMVTDMVMRTKETAEGRLAMTPEIVAAIAALRLFLYDNVYRSHQVHDDFKKAMKILRELYEYFMVEDIMLPSGEVWGVEINYPDETPRHRRVCDFIAGMTDRYALDLYTQIFFPKPWSVV